jgi:two-component system response regulator HydG
VSDRCSGVAASNKDLKKEIREGRFREDLFYRLNVVALTVPPLRDRAEDIPLMAQQFLKTFAERNARTLSGFTPRALVKLGQYSWPGNIRELMNAVERAVVLARGAVIDADDLVFPMAEAAVCADGALSGGGVAAGALSLPLEEFEKRSILEALAAAARQQKRSGPPPGHHPQNPAQEAGKVQSVL